MDPTQDVTLHVCVTCKDPAASEISPGAALMQSLSQAAASPVRIKPVTCLSVCTRPCTIALSGPGRWTYIVGDLPPTMPAEMILETARHYAAAPEGLIPWRQRPDWLRKGVVARCPPLLD